MRVNYIQRMIIETECNRILSLLKKSIDSPFSNKSAILIIDEINSATMDIGYNGCVDYGYLEDLIAPTASLQEIAFDNGWGNDFIDISKKLYLVIKELKSASLQHPREK